MVFLCPARFAYASVLCLYINDFLHTFGASVSNVALAVLDEDALFECRSEDGPALFFARLRVFNECCLSAEPRLLDVDTLCAFFFEVFSRFSSFSSIT